MGILAPWLEPLADAETMREIDRWAMQERGVDGLELMERAGTGVARELERLAADGPLAVICGKGNNGGDGLVAARVLREAGRHVTIVCVTAPGELSGDARVNLERLPGDPPVRPDGQAWASGDESASEPAPTSFAALDGACGILDALLGTGFSGEPHGAIATAIAALNGAEAPILSVDVPSGVDASSGVVRGAAVCAHTTVTFHAAKPGLWIRPGKACAGVVRTLDIGIPRGAPAGERANIGLLSSRLLALLPRREASSTKFSSGHVLVVGGSRGLTGAPRMAAHASMRAGAGYVTVCVPEELQPLLATGGLPEMMTRALPGDDGSLTADGLGPVLEASARGGALVLGPGLGRSEPALAFARDLASAADVALVLDADGLNAHAGQLEALARRSAPTVLTPHAGELGRLLDLDSAEIERERLRHVRVAAERSGAVVVLKGDDTLVADPRSGHVAVSPGASPALATAGTGDVLGGVIAALLAQGLDGFCAASCGVWLHAEAGRAAARRLGAAEGVIASDVIEALPRARAGAAAEGAGGT